MGRMWKKNRVFVSQSCGRYKKWQKLQGFFCYLTGVHKNFFRYQLPQLVDKVEQIVLTLAGLRDPDPVTVQVVFVEPRAYRVQPTNDNSLTASSPCSSNPKSPKQKSARRGTSNNIATATSESRKRKKPAVETPMATIQTTPSASTTQLLQQHQPVYPQVMDQGYANGYDIVHDQLKHTNVYNTNYRQ